MLIERSWGRFAGANLPNFRHAPFCEKHIPLPALRHDQKSVYSWKEQKGSVSSCEAPQMSFPMGRARARVGSFAGHLCLGMTFCDNGMCVWVSSLQFLAPVYWF